MRKLIFALSLSAALMLTLVASAAAPANFAGTWALDKAKSQNLGRLQNAESVTWVITQDGKQITIEQKVTGDMGGGPGGGGPGGGGGGRGPGGGGMGGPRSYNLDGTETTSENGPAKNARKASWSKDEKTLELSQKTTFTTPDGERTSTTNEKLELSGEGKVLTVNRHSDGGPRGPQDSTYVFNKQ